MKKIEAFIKKHRLNEVVEELHMIDGLTGISVYEVKGFGRDRNSPDGHVHITDDPIKAEPHVKLEIFCLDKLLEEVVTTIKNAAHTGLRGDGKIYISEISDAVRISTGDSGDSVC